MEVVKIFVGSNSNKRIEIFGSHLRDIFSGKDSVSSLTEGFWTQIIPNSEFHVGDGSSL